jgi:hypothetical protein
LHKITERQQIDYETFHNDVVPSNKPVVIRSLGENWSAVEQSRDSATEACRYLERLDNNTPVYTIVAPPSAEGRFFYSDDLQGVNFKRGQIPLAQVLTQLNTENESGAPHSIAVQALPIRTTLPEFEKENPNELIDASVAPTMWIGNKGRVAPHFDVHRNLACVVAGKRHFILFPPDQIQNLYLGPVLGSPGGVAMSLVDAWNPDLDKYPRYADALAVAEEAVLEPGDAIYIPSLWWHAVASIEPLNILVNYWWGGINSHGVSPNDSLLHAMMTMADLDDSQLQAWRDYFDYFLFQAANDPAGHLPSNISDIVTSLSPEQAKNVKDFLSEHLNENL